MRSRERPEVLRRRRRRRIVWVTAIVIFLAGTVYWRMTASKVRHALEGRQWEERQVEVADIDVVVSETGILEPQTQVIVKSQVAAEVKEILVNEGDPVALGDVIAILDESRVQQDVQNRAAQVDSALAGLRGAELTLTQTGKVSDAQLASAQASLKTAQAALDMTKEGLRPEDVRQTEERAAQRQEDLAAAQAQLAELQAGSRTQEVAEQEQIVEQAASQVAQADAELRKLVSGNRAEEILEGRAQLEQANSAELAAQATAEKLRRGSRPQEIRRAEADLESAEAKLTEAKTALDRQSELHEAGFVSDQDLDRAVSAYASAKATARSQQEALDLLREGSRAEDIRAAEADLAGAQASVRAATQRLAVLESGPRGEDIEKQGQAVSAARATLAAQRARLDMLREGTRTEQITQQQAVVRRLEAAVREADAALESARNGSRPQEIDEAVAKLADAQAGLDRAQAETIGSDVRAQDITDANAQLQAARTQLVRAQEDLLDCTVRSPIEGIVLRRHIEPGELAASGTTGLAQGTPIVTVGDTSQLVVRLEAHEVDVVNLSVGLPAEIQFDSVQGETFAGTVQEIAPQSSAINQEQAAGRTGGTQASVVTYQVKVSLKEQDERLRPGMSARVKVICQRVEQVPTVTIAALRSKDDRTFVLAPPEVPGGEPVERTVELGVRGASTVEVKAGLEVGDTYLIRKPETKFDIRKQGQG